MFLSRHDLSEDDGEEEEDKVVSKRRKQRVDQDRGQDTSEDDSEGPSGSQGIRIFCVLHHDGEAECACGHRTLLMPGQILGQYIHFHREKSVLRICKFGDNISILWLP
ncbi:MAG: hypothetical protein HW380_2180 [Magnetococcales bacterium]|nr:hypothetical protein [Magnetococcales bacterium]